MSETKLKPCPFCGGEIKGGVRLTGYMKMNIQYIQCDTCGAKMESKYSTDNLSQTNLKVIMEELINNWNTRKPMDNIVAELEKALENLEYNKKLFADSRTEYGERICENQIIAFKMAIDIVRKGGVE